MRSFSSFSSQSRGIALMIVGIFAFAAMDATVKGLTQRIDVVQALWARYAGQTVLVFVLILPRLRSVLRTNHPGTHFMRSCLQLGATSFFFFSLTQIGLAEATAIMDLSPVLMTLGAALFLGERFGVRRAIGVAAALIGALIVIRPGSSIFTIYALLPLVAAVCFAAFSLLTRKIGRNDDPWTSLFYTGVVGSVVLTIWVTQRWIPPSPLDWALMALIACLGATGQLMLIRALGLAEASTVAPFTYAGLIFATMWGALLYGEFPDLATYIGGAIIVLSGLYVWHRETRDAGKMAAAKPAETPVMQP